jgi:hypothetical protein
MRLTVTQASIPTGGAENQAKYSQFAELAKQTGMKG